MLPTRFRVCSPTAASATSKTTFDHVGGNRGQKTRSHPVDEVELSLSGELFGGDPRGLLAHLGLSGHPLGDDRWLVRPTHKDSFFTSSDLFDETGFVHRIDQLDEAPENDESVLGGPEQVEGFARLQAQLTARIEGSGDADIAARFHQIQLNVMRARRSELRQVVREAYDLIGQIKVEREPTIAFPHRSANFVTTTDLLIRRARLPGILLRFDQDPDTMVNIKRLEAEGESTSYFATSTEWFQEVIGIVHYLGPLVGCLSPRFWCLPASRTQAVVLFNLGRDISGFRHSPMETMQLLPGAGRDEPTPEIPMQSAAGRHAIHWWVVRLNQMFNYLLDPTVFKNAEGFYDPYDHQHWLLTIGQIFELTTALQASSRNRAVQRGLMYTLLDTYADKIGEIDFERLCTLKYANSAANRVRAAMPPSVAEVLMPNAQRAIDALERMQAGFFIQRQRNDDEVVLRLRDGRVESRSPERATALLLKIFRNATHGFGHRKGAKAKALVDSRLLAHHTGELPDDIVFLPYLYLLDLLCDPKQIRSSIARQVARPD